MSVLIGPRDWRFSTSAEGHRNYEVDWLVEAENDPELDDPSVIATTPGLPLVGSLWSALGFINGADDWARCTPEMNIRPHDVKEGEAPLFYLVTTFHSTEPRNRCSTNSIQNPLNEPADVSGSWVTKRTQPNLDKDGLPYRSSTGEPLIGPETEVDDNDWEINIEFNSISLGLTIVNTLRHRLNNSPLWGLPAEKVKFSKYSFRRLLYGTCSFYYRHSMGFQIRDDWKQYLADKGRMKLRDGGTATNPADWVRATDAFGEVLPMMRLDTSGQPIVSDSQTPNTIIRNPYYTGNLLLLGIPASF